MLLLGVYFLDIITLTYHVGVDTKSSPPFQHVLINQVIPCRIWCEVIISWWIAESWKKWHITSMACSNILTKTKPHVSITKALVILQTKILLDRMYSFEMVSSYKEEHSSLIYVNVSALVACTGKKEHGIWISASPPNMQVHKCINHHNKVTQLFHWLLYSE